MNRLFKILIVMLLFAGSCAHAQCPSNIGFENGSFDKWELFTGTVNEVGIPILGTATASSGSHQLFERGDASLDKYGHFPVVCPNGSRYSMKLGNETTGKGAERASFTYTIPAGAIMTLILNYAVVLGDPLNNHADVEQPRFTAKIYNVTDNVAIACPSFDFIASSGPSFSLSDVESSTTNNNNPNGNPVNDRNVRFREWTATTINLEGYGGKTIRLEFTTNDCTKGGHFGYAYLDIDETICEGGAITGANFCVGQSTFTLRGPGGFADYRWYEGTNTTGNLLGVGQALTLPVPADGTQYTLLIEPYPGLGCPSILHVAAKQIQTPFVMKVLPVITACANSFVNLKAASVTAGSASNLAFSYHTNPITLEYLASPEHITKPGIYYIKGTQTEGGGCTDVMPVEVKFIPPPSIGTLPAKTVQYPGTVDLTMLNPGFTYEYFKDATGKVPLNNFTAVSESGTYYIRTTDTGTGCQSSLEPVKVVIGPPAPFVVDIPTAFTPNNDGVNDVLNIGIKGFLAFDNLKIYNRYGNLVYTTRVQADGWAGTFHGKPLPVGAYYWIFEGVDTYYKIPVRKSGSVAILR